MPFRMLYDSVVLLNNCILAVIRPSELAGITGVLKRQFPARTS